MFLRFARNRPLWTLNIHTGIEDTILWIWTCVHSVVLVKVNVSYIYNTPLGLCSNNL